MMRTRRNWVNLSDQDAQRQVYRDATGETALHYSVENYIQETYPHVITSAGHG